MEEGGRLLEDSTLLPSSDFGSSLEYFYNTYEPVSVKTETKGNKQLLPLTPLLTSWGHRGQSCFLIIFYFFMPASMPSIHACVFLTLRTIKMDPPVKESLYPK